MSERNFGELFAAQMQRGKHLCVGLDTDFADAAKTLY